jgi:predicted transcriptional regulator
MTEEKPDVMGHEDLLRMTAEVVAAYVGNNMLPASQIPDVIIAVHSSLSKLNGGNGEAAAQPAKPAVPIRRSVTPDFIVCLEDGKKLKMLKRHLRTNYNMTPDEYRAKWGLSPDYPMVAPNYAAQRSAFAKKIGLGRSTVRKSGRRAAKR